LLPSRAGLSFFLIARGGCFSVPRITGHTEKIRYTLYGVLLGFVFPCGSLAYLYFFDPGVVAAAVPQWGGVADFVVQAHRAQPLLYVIDTAPFFLGLFAYLAGVREDRLRRLAASLEAEVQKKTEDLRAALEEARRANETIAALAQYDSLTNLFNRRRFQQELERVLQHAQRYGREFALVFLDLDGFKRINDRAGHAEGDRYLLAVAEVLRKALRATDIVARWGGDEFAMLLPETGVARAEEVAKKLITAMDQKRVALAMQVYTLRASIGVAVFPKHAREAEELLRRADAAMYEAKRAGGGTWRMSAPGPDREE
jgi:diguanylate cyclase (GGDEF)-like protein